ncbi:MAG: nucleoside-diphosphate kinase [Patescibacteria group bacterium]|nr:hypothetical protein [Patescibacteria group bacterium]
MRKEKVLIFLKPDGVELALRTALVDLLLQEDLSILEEHVFQLDENTVGILYAPYQDAWFFDQLVDYLTSGSSQLFICEGVDANAKVRNIRGNSYDGNGLRGRYSSYPVPSSDGRLILLKNVMHVSEPEDFQKEYKLLETQVV